jgi:N-acetyl sugar amidotransferase
MTFCKRCLYGTNHPLNLTIDQRGLCSGCLVHEEKDILDWTLREEMLKQLLEQYRCKNSKNYDCIIPVSGGRDSHFIVHVVKNKFKMNPLLVSYNKQYNTNVGIRNLTNLRTKFNCDIISKIVNPVSVKSITRETLHRMGSLYWHCLAGETAFPVQTAVQLKIPLIIWGAHQGVDQVGMFSHLDEVEMTRKYRKEHDLMGFEAEDLYGEMENLTEDHLSPFYYPDDYYLQRVGVRGIYLNNYIRWDTRAQHEEMINLYEYETANVTRSFDKYNDVDSYIYSDLHDVIKNLKHGYSKVLDHACREIRLGRMSREEALKLVRFYGSKPAKHVELFLKWLGMTASGLNYLIDELHNPEIWERDDNWNWQRKSVTSEWPKHDIALPQNTAPFEPFLNTKKYHSTDSKEEYILIGKGNRLTTD